MERYPVGMTCGLILLGLLGSFPAAAAELENPDWATNYDVLNGPYSSPGAAIGLISHNRLEYDPVLGNMISQISEPNIRQTTSDLQNLSTRVYPSRGNGQAADYLYTRLAGIHSLEVEYQSDRYRNVIASLAGKDTASDEVIIVGAHYDSISPDPEDAPGATDNACGVATVLELARVMSTYQFNHSIRFAFWNAEEKGEEGSTEYVTSASESCQDIPLYLNYDITYYDPNNQDILDIIYNEESKPYAELLTRYNSLYAINFNLTYNLHDCGSDHESFWQGGYPAITTHSQVHPPDYHTQNDTIELISSGFAKRNAQLGTVLLATKAGPRLQDSSMPVEPVFAESGASLDLNGNE